MVAAGAGVGYLFAKYPDVPPAENITVVSTPEKVARGEYLSKHVSGCVVCHAEHDYDEVRGAGGPGHRRARRRAVRRSVAARCDRSYSKNITPAAIGTWTDGELIRAFTAGVNKDGEPLFPIMPYPRYGKMSRDDVEAIVVYVRTLQADRLHARRRASWVCHCRSSSGRSRRRRRSGRSPIRAIAWRMANT